MECNLYIVENQANNTSVQSWNAGKLINMRLLRTKTEHADIQADYHRQQGIHI